MRIGYVLRNAHRSIIARNTLWMLLAQGVRLGIQGVYFLLLARELGAEEFGVLAGVLAVISILAPFSGWGTGNVLIMKVTRKPDLFPVYWGRALWMISVTGLVLTFLTVVIGPKVLPSGIPVSVPLCLALAEFIFGRLIEVTGQAFQAFERLHLTARVNVVLGSTRLAAVIAFSTVVDKATVSSWAWWYLSASIIGGVWALYTAFKRLGWPSFSSMIRWTDIKDGFLFSLGVSAKSVYADIDKAVLARRATLEDAGVYGVAYRVINFAFAPVQALMAAAYPKFFQEGERGIRAAVLFSKQLAPISGGYGVFVGVGLSLLAPILPVILGPDYTEAAEVLRWLAWVPVLQAIHYLAADVLTGTGYQGVRSVVQVGIAGLNVILNLILIASYSWRGAAWATLISEFSLGVVLWSLIVVLSKRRAPTEGPS